MKKIPVHGSTQYEVLVGEGLLAGCGSLIAEVSAPCRAVIITDDTVDGLYGDTVARSLEQAGFSVCRYAFPHGEQSKNWTVLGDVLEWLAAQSVTRTDLIVALGGGVVGDLAGFAAATYLRGIRFVQIPTTFLAAIDSSVGGKTAVDLAAGKNLAGAFWQPIRVICDIRALDTLPEVYFLDGVAEAIKYGVIADETLFEQFENGSWKEQLEAIIARCVEIKAAVVHADERDTGERRKLNLGHTLGHAIERCSGLAITHGHAVGIGTVLVARACERRGLSAAPCLERIIRTLAGCGLPTGCTYDAASLAAAAMGDKKRRGNTIALVLPNRIGACSMVDLPIDELEAFIVDSLTEE